MDTNLTCVTPDGKILSIEYEHPIILNINNLQSKHVTTFELSGLGMTNYFLIAPMKNMQQD
jgi:hypothetical protein